MHVLKICLCLQIAYTLCALMCLIRSDVCVCICVCHSVRVLSPVWISSFSHPFAFPFTSFSLLLFVWPSLALFRSLLCLPAQIPSISLCVVVHFAMHTFYIGCTVYTYKIHTVRYLSWEIVCECKIRYPIIRKWFFEWKSTRIWQLVSCKSGVRRWERAGVYVLYTVCAPACLRACACVCIKREKGYCIAYT